MPVRKIQENDIVLAKKPYIYYLLSFYKDKKNKVFILIDFGNVANVITQAYVLKLGL